MGEKVWTSRWRMLKEAHFSKEDALLVFQLLDETRAFGTQTLATSALDQLEAVYA